MLPRSQHNCFLLVFGFRCYGHNRALQAAECFAKHVDNKELAPYRVFFEYGEISFEVCICVWVRICKVNNVLAMLEGVSPAERVVVVVEAHVFSNVVATVLYIIAHFAPPWLFLRVAAYLHTIVKH